LAYLRQVDLGDVRRGSPNTCDGNGYGVRVDEFIFQPAAAQKFFQRFIGCERTG
jgi:hypothetical protein